MANIINFLSELQEQGYEYNTLNVHRSALSAYHPPIGGVKVGQLPLVTRMMGGSFNIRPKYVNTWDVGHVLATSKHSGTIVMSLSTLTQKTAMLMALCTAGRGSELRAANIETMADMGTCIIFPIAELTKSKRVAKPNFSLKLSQYEKDKRIDVVTTVRSYIQRTAVLRNEKDKKQLFIATVKPHSARWLKWLMSASGIVDTSVHKAHSTRSVCVSNAKSQGLSVDQILQRANWSQANTVQSDNAFQDAVLTSN